ncbi:protein quiver [Nephila pilipes]|uniref:UPAR/Ly6 domain-containing protein qvr n=1 Tax=Nephila pilipes TaxID=299642 RepID=A0A8X6T1T9_NEPPI|nr:protein quiver [Nephila pilipes]
MSRIRIAIYSIFTVFAVSSCVSAEGECMNQTNWCYDCYTNTDSRCKDPFNSRAHPNDLPPLKQCEGCCVKIVMDPGTPKEVIQRTCTKNLQLNLYIIDHVCMFEDENKGQMCFCENDRCNAVAKIAMGDWAFMMIAFLGVMFLNIRQICKIF